MVPETPNDLDPLLPERYPQHDLFICDVADTVAKDIMQHMEHPFYSLSKKPDTAVRRYEHNGKWIEVIPSVKGLATIYDKDILIYCISQIMHKLSRGEKVSPRVRIYAHEVLIFTNRGTGGRDYEALLNSLERLRGTTISTNILSGGEEQTDVFGLIDTASIKRTEGQQGRLLWCEIVLSEWVFNAIREKEVLKIDRRYFRLRKPLHRRLYEVGRKHCGRQPQWKCSIEVLHRKTGSRSPMKRFRFDVKAAAKTDHLPEYRLVFDPEGDMVTYINRGELKPLARPTEGGARERTRFMLKAETYEIAREVAPGYDIYALEQEWRTWAADKGPVKSADRAFIGFCRRRVHFC